MICFSCICMLMLTCSYLRMRCSLSCWETSRAWVAAAGTGWLVENLLAGPLLCFGPKEELQESSFVFSSSTYRTCLHAGKESPRCWILISLFLCFSLFVFFSFSLFSSLLFPSVSLSLTLSSLAVVRKASVMPNSRCRSYSKGKRRSIV